MKKRFNPRSRSRQGGSRSTGSVMVEFAIGASLLAAVFAGTFQFGYTFYVYNNVQTAVNNGAKYAALRTYEQTSSTPSSCFTTAVQDMVVYGDPTGVTTTPVAPGLKPAKCEPYRYLRQWRSQPDAGERLQLLDRLGLFDHHSDQQTFCDLSLYGPLRAHQRVYAMNPAIGTGRQNGSAMVEAALVFLVFVSMLIGIFDFGQFLFIHQTLTERAREAVRYGIVNSPTNVALVQNVVLYGQASGGSVPPQPGNTDTGIFNLKRTSVVVTTPGIATDDYRLLVQIQNYTYNMYSPGIAGSFNGPAITASLPLGIN